MNAQKFVRYVFTALLLIIVWLHVHWSVALCLTLNAVGWELLAYRVELKARGI